MVPFGVPVVVRSTAHGKAYKHLYDIKNRSLSNLHSPLNTPIDFTFLSDAVMVAATAMHMISFVDMRKLTVHVPMHLIVLLLSIE